MIHLDRNLSPKENIIDHKMLPWPSIDGDTADFDPGQYLNDMDDDPAGYPDGALDAAPPPPSTTSPEPAPVSESTTNPTADVKEGETEQRSSSLSPVPEPEQPQEAEGNQRERGNEANDDQGGTAEKIPSRMSTPLSPLSPAPDDDEPTNEDDNAANEREAPTTTNTTTNGTANANTAEGGDPSMASTTNAAALTGVHNEGHNPNITIPPSLSSSSSTGADSKQEEGDPKAALLLELNAELLSVCLAFQSRGILNSDLMQQYAQRVGSNLSAMTAQDPQTRVPPLPHFEPPPPVDFVPVEQMNRIRQLYADLPNVFAKDIQRRQQMNMMITQQRGGLTQQQAQAGAGAMNGVPTPPNPMASTLAPPSISSTLKRERPEDPTGLDGAAGSVASISNKRRDTGENKMMPPPSSIPISTNQPGQPGQNQGPMPTVQQQQGGINVSNGSPTSGGQPQQLQQPTPAQRIGSPISQQGHQQRTQTPQQRPPSQQSQRPGSQPQAPNQARQSPTQISPDQLNSSNPNPSSTPSSAGSAQPNATASGSMVNLNAEAAMAQRAKQMNLRSAQAQAPAQQGGVSNIAAGIRQMSPSAIGGQPGNQQGMGGMGAGINPAMAGTSMNVNAGVGMGVGGAGAMGGQPQGGMNRPPVTQQQMQQMQQQAMMCLQDPNNQLVNFAVARVPNFKALPPQHQVQRLIQLSLMMLKERGTNPLLPSMNVAGGMGGIPNMGGAGAGMSGAAGAAGFANQMGPPSSPVVSQQNLNANMFAQGGGMNMNIMSGGMGGGMGGMNTGMGGMNAGMGGMNAGMGGMNSGMGGAVSGPGAMDPRMLTAMQQQAAAGNLNMPGIAGGTLNPAGMSETQKQLLLLQQQARVGPGAVTGAGSGVPVAPHNMAIIQQEQQRRQALQAQAQQQQQAERLRQLQEQRQAQQQAQLQSMQNMGAGMGGQGGMGGVGAMGGMGAMGSMGTMGAMGSVGAGTANPQIQGISRGAWSPTGGMGDGGMTPGSMPQRAGGGAQGMGGPPARSQEEYQRMLLQQQHMQLRAMAGSPAFNQQAGMNPVRQPQQSQQVQQQQMGMNMGMGIGGPQSGGGASMSPSGSAQGGFGGGNTGLAPSPPNSAQGWGGAASGGYPFAGSPGGAGGGGMDPMMRQMAATPGPMQGGAGGMMSASQMASPGGDGSANGGLPTEFDPFYWNQ